MGKGIKQLGAIMLAVVMLCVLGSENVAVYGYTGSYAETYTKENEYEFIFYDDANSSNSYTEAEVESLELVTPPIRDYYYGDVEWGYLGWENNEPGDSTTYDLNPDDLSGLQFKINYNDGTSRTYSDADIDKEKRMIDGHSYYIGNVYNAELGELPVTFQYMGKTLEYTVTLKESPITSVEILKGPDLSLVSYGMQPFPDGMQLCISYADGSNKNITVDEDDIQYGNWSDNDVFCDIHIELDGHLAVFDFSEYDCTYYIYYMGCICWDELEYSSMNSITDFMVDNVSPDGNGMEVTFKYQGGSTETFILEPVHKVENVNTNENGQKENWCYGDAKTSGGILKYQIITTTMEENRQVYEIDILGKTINLTQDNLLLGDSNNDKQITLKDAQMTLKAALKIIAIDEIDEAAADVDGKAGISLADAQMILKAALKIITL